MLFISNKNIYYLLISSRCNPQHERLNVTYSISLLKYVCPNFQYCTQKGVVDFKGEKIYLEIKQNELWPNCVIQRISRLLWSWKPLNLFTDEHLVYLAVAECACNDPNNCPIGECECDGQLRINHDCTQGK